MPDPLRDELLHVAAPCQYQSGESLMREGDRSTHVVLLLSGIAKISARLDEGHEALLAIRASGDVVGEMAAMDGKPRSATVTACGAIRAGVVQKNDLHAFFRRHPEAALSMGSVVAERLRWANRRRIEFAGYPVKVRLARVLAELAASHGRPVLQGLVIGVNLSQPELAALAGSAEDTVQKALRALREEGLLTTGHRRISVLDLRRLREIGHLPPGIA
ncbi:Crp/Fnr family transcriptional regulator [Streptomyces hoynatensis]|uniref:Crp/Fnr family transcriptional regulator n=1 Tax=Streptomyces hoynatensis TaxID=1141874 RepID=UPI001F4DB3DB|nr:Crp/Fnr family transcriptional regulator [Streptomyces hoynatensis]